ncbi:IS1380 family transposase [Thiocapsa sp.]|uniref:IS1380 family transposase n=1 Tax=Thiocapsa sp. TaxID=2024551 RepID=UPI003592F110
MTQCNEKQLEFHGLGRRQIVGRFDGGAISSDGGGLLLGEVEARTGIIARLAEQFVDHRDPELIEHSVRELIGQRVYGLALGYADLNDHDRLRLDPLLAVLVGKRDPSGEERARARDRGKALASSSTLNPLELTPWNADAESRYKKIVAKPGAIDRLMVDCFLDAHATAPTAIWLDLDATDAPLHGNQEGRFFHGYDDHYCCLPLYIFSGEHLLCARRREADMDAAAGSVEEVDRIVTQIRARWPGVEIILRGDSGFCREDLMAWCEANGVHFLFGLAKNGRLTKRIGDALIEAERQYHLTGRASRVFEDFTDRTRTRWGRARRVVGKAEDLYKGPNPRFVVTSLPAERADARTLYEELYCARGDMENRIKEQQLDLFADRTSTHTLRANQLRLYLSSFAYILLCALRTSGLQDTELQQAQCGTIRSKLLKIGARVRVTVRKVWIAFSESYPFADLFRTVLANLQGAPRRAGAP